MRNETAGGRIFYFSVPIDWEDQAEAVAGLCLFIEGGAAGWVCRLPRHKPRHILTIDQADRAIRVGGDDEILPQTAHVTLQVRRIEVVEDEK